MLTSPWARPNCSRICCSVTDRAIGAAPIGEDGSRVQCGDFHDPPAKAAGQIIEDEDTNETVEKIVAWLEERKLI